MSDDDRSGLTRRRLLGGLAATGTAAAGVGTGAGAYALFSDEKTSTGNRVQAGTLDLTTQQTDTFELSLADGVNTNLPGEDLAADISVEFDNVGSLRADHLELDFVVSADEDNNGNPADGLTPGPESDTDQSSADGMGDYIRVERLTYTNADGTQDDYVLAGAPATTAGVEDTNGNGYVDVNDLEAVSGPGYGTFDDLAPPRAGATTTLELTLSGIAQTIGDRYQGDVVTLAITATLYQAASQGPNDG